MKSSPLHQCVEFTFPAPGDLTGLNPFGTRDIGLRGVMAEPDGVLKVGVPIFVNDIAGKLARRKQ